MLEENLKAVSVHVPKHKKPESEEDFGHYLAGLIDGSGVIGPNEVKLYFDIREASLAFFIKKKLGFGQVKKEKKVHFSSAITKEEALTLIIKKREGVEKVLFLIKDKRKSGFEEAKETQSFIKAKALGQKPSLLTNYWLSGFIDTKASFEVERTKGKPKEEGGGLQIGLSLQIIQKEKNLLVGLQKELGGNIKYKAKEKVYYYSSTNFGAAVKVIAYLDKFHMLSSKHIAYLK